jgi:hypothetical protein
MPGIKFSKLEDVEIVEIELACSVHALPGQPTFLQLPGTHARLPTPNPQYSTVYYSHSISRTRAPFFLQRYCVSGERGTGTRDSRSDQAYMSVRGSAHCDIHSRIAAIQAEAAIDLCM